MRSSRKSIIVIVVITIILVLSSFLEMLMVFRLTSRQTTQSGTNRLASIGGQLTATIGAAMLRAQQFAVNAESLLDDKELLERYIRQHKAELIEESDGICFNCYTAGSDWHIIPDFVEPEGFVAQERVWYVNAIRSGGQPFVTDPYVDAVTGNICFTVSVMLPDHDTVCAVDLTMDGIQHHIEQMDREGNKAAVIVTAEGIIAGCTDQSRIGKNIIQEMPELAGIFSLAKSGEDQVSYRHGGESLFASRSNSGWILIVSEDTWTLFQTSIIQILAMLVITLVIFAIITILYLISVRNAKRAEAAYAYKEQFLEKISADLQEPLKRILSTSSPEYVAHASDPEIAFSAIHTAGTKLSETISKILSYSSIVRTEKAQKQNKTNDAIRIGKRSRALILISLTIVMGLSIFININATMRHGSSMMQKDVSNYQYQLDEWINTQKSIMDMFCSIISTHPEMVTDYEGTRRYLDAITAQYPEISVSYWVNQSFPHSVCMNNGWYPDSESWHVEERDWYKETMSCEEGWSISAPYFDKQTGLYCITFSKRIYNSNNDEFLGVFGIDFYMDKLVDILGSCYSDTSYAFLTDASGEIINHPFGKYQMTADGSTNVAELSYRVVEPDGSSVFFVSDYDGSNRAMIAARNSRSRMTIYVASGLTHIYGSVLLYGMISLFAMILCIVLLYRLITGLLHLQEQATLKIRESAEAAIAADAAKTSFLAQMSHEIRTPINAVLGMNEMILRETPDPGIRSYAVNIQSAGRTLLALINSILDFSKIEDGKMEILPVEYDTASLIHDLVSSITPRASGKGLELRLSIDSNLPSALIGDDVRMRQIITNLLTNAVKYTEHGSVTLVLQQESRDVDNIMLYVEVTDTGIGIREEDIGALFDSFRRLDEKRNRNIEGTGLGMSIVNGLLGMMDSKLHVQSTYGSGSTFSFRVKQGIANREPLGDYEHRLSESSQSQQQFTLYAPDASILVIDDNEMNLRVAMGLLRLCGITPDLAGSGAQAIEMVEKKRYDMIFLDHMMPKMDGLETLKQLREKQILPQSTVVIALTANAIVGAREMYLNAGFDDYISKPIESCILEKRLSAYLPKEKVSYREQIPPAAVPKKEEPEMDMFTIEEMQEIREKCPALNVMTGLNYCMDSKEFYLESLQMFLDADQREAIGAAYDAGDFNNYRISVHALKSAALTIGAVLLSDHAKALEMAAKSDDTGYIHTHHAALMVEYQEVLTGIGKVVEK